MSDALATLLTAATAPGTAPAIILDAAAYAQRVLLQDREAPWHDATAYSNHLGQAQALLKPPVALVPLDRLFAHELREDAALVEAMGARSRTGFAAKTLLGDERVRRLASELVATAVKTQREPVVLHLPSPLALLTLTTRAALGDEAELSFDADDAENIAIYYADWLRVFAEQGIAGVIFDERAGGESALPAEAYQPILGAAEHYRWPIGLRGASELRFLSPEAVVPVLDGSILGQHEPLESGAPEASGTAGVLFAEIPADAVPEQVLARLAELRAAR